MATVQTVTGPIDASELGFTLIHEHLRARDEAVHAQWPQARTTGGLPEREQSDDGSVAAVESAAAAVDLGVKTICDPTAMFLDRDVAFMRRVAERTGLQVVPCTGIYTYDHLPPFFLSRDADRIADLYVSDLEQGVQGTDIRAAFIKCAADEPGITENVEKLHRAAARASVRTGAPIMAHSRPLSDTAPRQIEILFEEGVEPGKIQIAHTGDSDDLDYIERILDTGVWIGLDRFGLEMYLPYEQRRATALTLFERGYADRLFLAADSCGTIDWFEHEVAEQMLAAGLAKDWNIRMVPERVIPDLREAGVTDEQIETVMLRNPVNWLTG